MGSMTGGSSVGSPSLPYHISMQSQQQQGPRPDSPGTNSILPSYLTSPPHNADSFAQASSQKTVNNSYQMYNSMNSNIHTPLGTDFSSVLSPEHDAALNPQSTTNGFSSPPTGPLRNSAFNPFPPNNSNGRPRHNTSTIRDTSGSFAAPSYPGVQQDIYISNPMALNQQPNPAAASFDPVHHQSRFDFGLGASQSAPSLVLSGQTKQPAFSAMDAYRLGLDTLSPTQPMRPSGGLGGPAGNGALLSRDGQPSQLSPLHQQPPGILNGLSVSLAHQTAMQTQNHFAALSSAANGATQPNASAVNGAAHGSSQQQQQQPQEEISTIFVVGFPDDMSEREFQNMFTFSSGFEAATLKIPNRELTSYGSAGLVSGAGARIGGLPIHSGSNDPYNLVTVNQGGVVVDGRDGTTSSWPAAPPMAPFMDESHFVQTTVQPPRKQIIGFAKFRTRQEALEARDVLQGRRVDLEKGSVLKAEMAKKNLHTKRGTTGVGMGGGPLGVGAGGSLLNGQASAAVQADSLGPSLNGLNNLNGNAAAASELFMQREKELGALGAMGLAGLGRRGTLVEERADVGTIGIATFGPRGARERAEEDERERERKRKEKEAARLRQNSNAFEAFHSVPQQMVRQGANSLLSAENGTIGTSSLGESRFVALSSQSSMQSLGDNTNVSPWGSLRDVGASAMSRKMTSSASTIQRPSSTEPQDFFASREATSSPPSGAQSGSESTNPSASFSPDSISSALPSNFASFSPQQDGSSDAQNQLSASSISSASSVSGLQGLNEEELARAVGALAVSTSQQGTISPQLPSPSSGTSSSTGRNPGDMNPPINTLYVGNLPASNSPGGSPSPYLEDRLRELFSRRPGFRKLCFRHKSNSPMCFVEFEDVIYATKALNELNGDNLGGLIRGGGIRLSFSKNPLGVRTPTSAGSGSSIMQQQSLNTLFTGGEMDSFRSSRRDTGSSGMTSPTSSYFYSNMSSPPPRFTSPPSFTSPLSNSTMFPRATPQGFGLSSGGSSSSFSPFGISSSQSSIPDQPSAESSNDPLTRTLSPVHANVEASR